MTDNTRPDQDDVPTLDLGGATSGGSNTNAPAPEDNGGEQMTFEEFSQHVDRVIGGQDGPDWYGDGAQIYAQPAEHDPQIIEFQTVAIVNEQVGLVTTELDVGTAWEFYNQLGATLGESREDTDLEEIGEDAPTDKPTRIRRAIDPVGLGKGGGFNAFLSASSPVSGLTWGTLLVIAFIVLTILFTIISKFL